MNPKTTTRWLLCLALLTTLLSPATVALAASPAARPAQSSGVTAYDLIVAMNTLRSSYGLALLVEDPIIDAVAQSTAEIMAASQMSWHIGNVGGRLASAGYGGGAKVWATENFAVGRGFTIDQIMLVWSDASHMIPAVNAAYCHIGAGVAQASDGSTYYVLQAAYTSSGACGDYTPSPGTTTKPGGTTDEGRVPGVSQVIVPVKIATPDPEGRIYHVVEAGQSFWAIAIAYKVTIKDLEKWNNLSSSSKLQIGQKLFIPGSNTEGYATPTPPGMVQKSTPDADGKIVHSVQAYQTLITIAQAYGTKVDTILALNGLQADWPLQIGQKLVIDPGHVTPSPTPRPLTPIERLTPASDGKYYHEVKSGETISGIAGWYGVSMYDLEAWNGLSDSSILQPGQKLLLQVAPPATQTPTPGPATATPTATLTPPPATATPAPSQTLASPTAEAAAPAASSNKATGWLVLIGLVGVGLVMSRFFIRVKR